MMKQSLRPMFIYLLLIAIGAIFILRVLVPRGNINLFVENLAASLSQPIFNSTILEHAMIQLGDENSKQEIDQLLSGNVKNMGSYRTISWRRVEKKPSQLRTRLSLPIQLRSSRYSNLWPHFRKYLHDWASNRRYQAGIMNQLVDLIKLPIDRHFGREDKNRFFPSCAIVGNSGILLNHEHGELIDRHDVVIRLNNARIEGYQLHVGTKTNISFVNSNILHLCNLRKNCYCHPYGEDVPLVIYICQPIHFMDYALCNGSQKAPIIVTDARFDILCARIVKYYSLKRFIEETGKSIEEWAPAHDGSLFHYSSGMQAVMLALGICEKVSIFGFGKSSFAKHHYHTNQKTELHLHDYEAEYALYRDLVQRPNAVPFISESGFKIPLLTIFD